MNLSRRYAEAHFPDRWTVLGVRLHSLTIGHALLLQRVGSPFAPYYENAQEAAPGLGDVLLALFILSRPAQVAADAIGTRRFRLLMWYWSARFKLSVALHPVKVLSIPTAAAKLVSYIVAGTDGPGVSPVGPFDGQAPGTPAIARLIRTLCGCLGRTMPEALATPITLAHWDCAAWWEREGSARIDLLDIDALTAEVKAELAAGRQN